MGWLAPWFLAGAVAVGLPVYLHLLRRHRQNPVPFSSLMFFERRTQSSIQHRRLQYLLLFALRCALILLLMIAFARPFLQSSSPVAAGGHRLLGIIVDRSFSMRQGDRLARAKQAALATANSMSGADRAQVLALGGGETRILTDVTSDRAAVIAAIQGIEPGDGSSAYAEVTRALTSLAKTANQAAEGHFYSDFQESSMPAAFSDLDLAGAASLQFHPAVNESVPNFAVARVQAPRRIFDTKKVRIVVTVAGFQTPAATRKISLLLNGRPIAQRTVEVPANSRATVEFLALDAPHGLSRGEVQIDHADAFPNDDHFYFPVQRDDAKPALFVHDARDLRSAGYFRTALESAGEAAFTLDTVTSDQAAGRDFERYGFVVLSDTGRVPASVEAALRSYTQKGGSVLVVLGHNHQTSGGRVPVADLAILGARYAAPERDQFLSASLDGTYPPVGPGVNWNGVRFYQAIHVEPAGARVAAKLSDGTPLLIDRPLGEGHVMVLTSALDNIENDLPLDPAFVALVERTSLYLGSVDATPAVYTTGAAYDLRTGKESSAPVEVLGPDNQRALSLAEARRANSFLLDREGFYDVGRANGRHELAAVNPDRRESDLTLVPQEKLDLWRGDGRMQQKNGPAGVSDEARRVELWWWILLGALALAIAESWVGNRHLAAKPEVDETREAAQRNVA